MMCSMSNQPNFGGNGNLRRYLKVQGMKVQRPGEFNFQAGRADDPAKVV